MPSGKVVRKKKKELKLQTMAKLAAMASGSASSGSASIPPGEADSSGSTAPPPEAPPPDASGSAAPPSGAGATPAPAPGSGSASDPPSAPADPAPPAPAPAGAELPEPATAGDVDPASLAADARASFLLEEQKREVREAREAETKALEQARVANDRAKAAEAKASDADAALREAESRAEAALRDADSRASEAESRASEAESRAAQAESRASEAESRASEAESRASEASRKWAEIKAEMTEIIQVADEVSNTAQKEVNAANLRAGEASAKLLTAESLLAAERKHRATADLAADVARRNASSANAGLESATERIGSLESAVAHLRAGLVRLEAISASKREARAFLRVSAAAEGDVPGADGMTPEGVDPTADPNEPPTVGASMRSAVVAATNDARSEAELVEAALAATRRRLVEQRGSLHKAQSVKLGLEGGFDAEHLLANNGGAVVGFADGPLNGGPLNGADASPASPSLSPGIGSFGIGSGTPSPSPKSGRWDADTKERFPEENGERRGPKDPAAMDAPELRRELERMKKYALRLQHRREDAARSALASENAAVVAREERDELRRVAEARVEKERAVRSETTEKFRVARAELRRALEDAENLRKVNRALSRELYGARAPGVEAPGARSVPSTPTRGDLKRVFDAVDGAARFDEVREFLETSGVVKASLDGVGALEGSAMKAAAAANAPGAQTQTVDLSAKLADLGVPIPDATDALAAMDSPGKPWEEEAAAAVEADDPDAAGLAAAFSSRATVREAEISGEDSGGRQNRVSAAGHTTGERDAIFGKLPPSPPGPFAGVADSATAAVEAASAALNQSPRENASSGSESKASGASAPASPHPPPGASASSGHHKRFRFSTFTGAELRPEEWRELETPTHHTGAVRVRSVAVLRGTRLGGALKKPSGGSALTRGGSEPSQRGGPKVSKDAVARAKAAIKKSGASDEYVDALAHPRTHPEDVEARIQAQIESALRKGAKTQKDHHPGSSHAHSVARSNNTPTSSTPRRDKENEERKTSAAASFQAAFQAAAFAWDESVALHAAEAAAKLEAAEAKELAKLRAKGVLGPEFETPADLPAHLRMREPASTAEDVDVAARRFARVFAANGVAVSLKRQAPFKYVLEPQPTSHRATAAKAGAHAARAPQAKIVVLKLEGHRLVVHVGGANRSVLVSPGGESRRRIAAPRDLVREIEEGRFAGPLVRKPPVQNPAPGLAGSSRKWLDPTRGEKPAGGAPFAGTPPPAVRPTSGLNVTSDMRFVPPPEEPATDRPVKGSSKQPSKTPKQFFDRLFGIQDKLAKKHAAESGGGQQRPRGDDAPEVAQRLEFAGALPASPRSGERSVSPAKHYPEGPRPFLKLPGSPAKEAPKHDGDAAKAPSGAPAAPEGAPSADPHRQPNTNTAAPSPPNASSPPNAPFPSAGGFASGSGSGTQLSTSPRGRKKLVAKKPGKSPSKPAPAPPPASAASGGGGGLDWFGGGAGAKPKAAASPPPPPKSQAQVETDISQMWFGAPPPQVSKRPKEDAGKGKAPTNPFEFGGGSSSGAGGAKAEEASDDWDLPPTKKKNPFG